MSKRRSRGFSLLEVLVAMGILAVVLPGLVAMFMGSKNTQVGSFSSEQATQFAEGKIDSLRWLGRSMLVPVGTWCTNQSTALNGKAANWRWKFDTVACVARRAGVVTVEVSWTQGKTAHSIVLQGGLP